MATFLVASFHTHPQLLHFNPSSSPPSLTLETLLTPSFQDYTWISRHPSINNLFYALQRFSDKPGILSIIRLAKNKDGRYQLEILKSYPSHGMDPCHLGISSQADKLAIANVNTSSPFLRLSNKAEHNTQYDSSTVTIYTLNKEDGMVNEDIEPEIYDLSRDENFKPGPNSERQEAPHPHGCFYVPKMQSFLVPDLGADRLRLIGKGKKESLPCNAGAGPRHAVINDKGGFNDDHMC